MTHSRVYHLSLAYFTSTSRCTALADALATDNRPLVYGGGNSGLMGVISGATAKSHGKVTGIIPYAIFAAGGEKDKGNGRATTSTVSEVLDEKRRGEVCSDRSPASAVPDSNSSSCI